MQVRIVRRVSAVARKRAVMPVRRRACVQPNDSISVMKRLQIAWMMPAPITSSGRIFVLL
jgi:hypothetical protein